MNVAEDIWIQLLFSPSVTEKLSSIKYVENEWLNKLTHLVISGSYEQFLSETDIQNVLKTNSLHLSINLNTISNIQQEISIISTIDDARLLVTLIGIVCLQLFIIHNFVGPKTTSLQSIINFQTINELNNEIVSFLTSDGEQPICTVEHLDYLFIAKQIFNNAQDNTVHWTHKWWIMRTWWINQKILQERSKTLYDNIQACINMLQDHEQDMESQQHRQFLSIEITYISQYYYNWSQAERYKNRTVQISGLQISLSGQLGKRTRYQVKDTSQLFVDVKRQNSNTNDHLDIKIDILPKDLTLNDDVLLNKIEYVTDNGNVECEQKLDIAEQLTLLLIINDYQVNNPKHEITTEELLAYLTYILAHPINWCVQTCSLVLRCNHETQNKRKIERTLTQLQELIDQYERSSPSNIQRLQYFHLTMMPPLWKLQSDLAKIYMSLGLINNALELYLHLNKWSEVIACYQCLNKMSMAENIIRDQLKVKETSDLYCSLGEVTGDISYYEKAWEFSKNRSGRAQRLMGKYYLNKGNFEKACEHLEKAVEINSLQHDTWFWLGSAAFRTEKWELGVKAYRRCTTIEPDNFEAWNNLAACYTKLKQKSKAHTVFQEAIKCNFDNWKVWENYLWTSADCGEIDDMIQAYHRLIDLKTKYVDKDVLKRLVYILKSENNDNSELYSKLYQKTLELFGRLTAEVINDADIWELYSDLSDLKQNQNIEWQTKILQQLQRAHRCLTSQTGWENQMEGILHVLSLSNKLGTKTFEQINHFFSNHIYDESLKQVCSSNRLLLNSVLTRLKQKYSDTTLLDDNQEVKSNYEQLGEILQKITDNLSKFQQE